MFANNSRRGDVRRAPEDGQATIALVAVLVVGCLAVVAISLIGQAMVHRAHARNAADAVALAAVSDPQSAQALRDWYGGRGITFDSNDGNTVARSGPSQAAAWAELGSSPTRPAPALVAIIARAEQLLETTLTPLAWNETAVTLSETDAALFAELAPELSLCESDRKTDAIVFELC